jgi:hypothetical protein
MTMRGKWEYAGHVGVRGCLALLVPLNGVANLQWVSVATTDDPQSWSRNLTYLRPRISGTSGKHYMV